jgi:CRP/FNR family cyclic AMP-dependent transcriptional regulator
VKPLSIAELISSHPLLSGIPEPDLETVAGCATNRVFRAEQLLLAEGQPAETFYLLRHGLVSIEIHSPGVGPVVIETVGPGGVVGWSWLFPPYRCHFDARALEPTRAVAFDGTCLRTKADTDDEIGHLLYKRVAEVLLERLQGTRVRLLDLYGKQSAR